MARGGPRPNSGRKRGSLSKKTTEIAVRAMEQGISPLEFMLNVLRDKSQPFDARYAAAKDSAPYVHAKLAAVEHSGDKDNPIHQRTRVEMVLIDAASDIIASQDDTDARPEEAGTTH